MSGVPPIRHGMPAFLETPSQKGVECHAVNCFAVCEATVIRRLPANPQTLRAGMNPVSVAPGSCPLRALALLPETPREVVEQGRKNQGDVPAPNETLDQAEKECRPAQEFEAWQEDAKRLVLYWERPSLTESESRD